ncbi:unnamed protein product [Lactuca virosa]|uniref:Defective in cullin neddylation protein n=1 Tax=Lactuca virosa TaxID=75947 RepID=A0AAU9P5M2_9ASTR|nr:unnamed protein product [Lactuca virosa]
MSGNGRKDIGRKNNPSSCNAGHRGRASPNSTNEPRHMTLLTPIDMSMIRGVVGSNSQGINSQQTDMDDPVADLFDDHSIHNTFIDLFWQSMDDVWRTYKSIMEKTRRQMFVCLRWYTMENEAIYTTFNNILKDRYRDRMWDLRKLFAKMSRRDWLPIQKGYSKYFPKMYQHRPDMLPESAWPRLYDRAQTGKEPKSCDLYVKTHGTMVSFWLIGCVKKFLQCEIARTNGRTNGNDGEDDECDAKSSL